MMVIVNHVIIRGVLDLHAYYIFNFCQGLREVSLPVPCRCIHVRMLATVEWTCIYISWI